jgi:ubiquitin C-terminal hydrolase
LFSSAFSLFPSPGNDYIICKNSGMTMKIQSTPAKIPEPKKILFARENVKSGWSKVDGDWNEGCGLLNIGNSCYINATLQALFHVPSFVTWLLFDEKHRKKSNCDGKI